MARYSAAMLTTSISLSFIVVAVFAIAHVLGPAFTFLHATPRSAYLSIAGGVSVAYVFVHLLPELPNHQAAFDSVEQAGSSLIADLERNVYLIALAGLTFFYGLHQMARSNSLAENWAGREKRPSRAAFWLHLASFAVNNVLIGYLLLHREETDVRSLVVYAVAMTLHFIVNDQGLRAYHGQSYDRLGRWLLAAAPLLGWLIGLAIDISSQGIAALFAFIAGGIVLNVMKEELPEDRESRFWPFALGTAGYTALLLLSS